MDLNRRSDILLLGFILFSLLLHLLFLYLLPKHALVPAVPEKKPVYVDLRPPQHLSRELDLPTRPELEKPRETPAKRLGPTDQVVTKETAPKGEDFDDRTPQATAPTQQQQPTASAQPSPAAPKPAPPVKKSSPAESTIEAELRRHPGKTGPPTPTEPAPAKPEVKPVPERTPPSPEQLKNLDLLASAKSAAASISEQWRRKYRTEVEEGDTVWLDTEKDILISFFQRFRRNVEMVWNYPEIAKELGQEGTCLLKVTITRDGDVAKVELKETSGYKALDEEAMDAIRKGASYGPLPKAFPKQELNIMVFFKYELTRSRPFMY